MVPAWQCDHAKNLLWDPFPAGVNSTVSEDVISEIVTEMTQKQPYQDVFNLLPTSQYRAGKGLLYF
ncbi:hypothetical protein AFK69_04910 [Xenorhabdus sp. GDc328]|nr:hypothetical protein AAY47_02130 [Xenorhabdus griffiniae]KOP34319.1 hypothetical protein AFK69_04910 [Xenorhabdus sp. GDc328]